MEDNLSKHAYLIMAHNQWDLLRLLLIAIDDPRNDIYLHIDSKVHSFPKEEIDSICKYSKLYYTKRYDVRWGGTEMMKCELEMIYMSSLKHYCYYHLLSGVDFPIKSQEYIHRFFDENGGKEYVGFDWTSIESCRLRNRSQFYHFWTKKIARGYEKTLSYKIFIRLEWISILLQEKMGVDRLKGKTYYKGSMWFSITHRFAEYIVKNRKGIISKYVFTLNSDEAFLQNLIKDAPENQFEIADSNLRYIKWIQGESSPVTLKMDEYEKLINTEKIFARKFDWNVDKEIVIKLFDTVCKEK